MSTTSKIIIVVVIVVIAAIGAWMLWKGKAEAPQETQKEATGPVAVTITYNGDAFSPSVATVKTGDVVKVVNQSDKVMEFASDPHPIHTDNPELNTGDIEPGASATITVAAEGVWGFHDHYNSEAKGTLTIE